MEAVVSKMCEKHLAMLEVEISRRGMEEQCAGTDEERISRLKSGNPDPFLDSQMRLQILALQMAGREACVAYPCPVCALENANWCAMALWQVIVNPQSHPGVTRIN